MKLAEDTRQTDLDEGIEWSDGDYVPHPDGIYEAEFVGFEKEDHEEYGKRLKLKFQTEAEMDNGDPYGISCYTKPSFHPKGRVRPMLGAMGVDVDKIKPQEFRLSEYIGERLVLVIEHEPRKNGGDPRAVIKSFQSIKKKKRQENGRKRPDYDDNDE